MPDLARAFEVLADDGINGDAFAGAVLRVEDGEGLRFEAARGWALQTPGASRPLAAQDRFDLASVSKLFTSTALLRLASLGDLDLDEPLGRLLSWEGTTLGALGGDRTCRRLLAHASGFHYWHPFYAHRGASFEDILTEVLLAHPPGAEVIYSDLNFILLGKVLEAITGASLRDAMADLVFRPLALGATAYGPVAGSDLVATEFGNRIEESMVADLGLSFAGWRPRDRAIVGEADDGNCHYYFGGAAGHAGIFAPAADLAALGRLYLSGGRLASGSAYLDPRLVAEATRDHGGGRGLGFQLGGPHPAGGFGHSGFTGTFLHINPEAGRVVVFLTNRLHVSQPRKIVDLYEAATRLGLGRPGPEKP